MEKEEKKKKKKLLHREGPELIVLVDTEIVSFPPLKLAMVRLEIFSATNKLAKLSLGDGLVTRAWVSYRFGTVARAG